MPGSNLVFAEEISRRWICTPLGVNGASAARYNCHRKSYIVERFSFPRVFHSFHSEKRIRIEPYEWLWELGTQIFPNLSARMWRWLILHFIWIWAFNLGKKKRWKRDIFINGHCQLRQRLESALTTHRPGAVNVLWIEKENRSRRTSQ